MAWQDPVHRAARRVPLWTVYLIGLAPIPWLFWLGVTGQLGVEPIERLEHRYGLLALQVMLAGLCVSPLRRLAGLNLIRFRRALGLIAFAYVFAHLCVWLFLDVRSATEIWADIVKRPYITIGMLGFVCLLPLALTSNDLAVRRLGGAVWRRLHLLTYPAVLLACAHFVMLTKGWQLEPLAYLAAALVLLGLRLRPPRPIPQQRA
jgi:sulfoxide reductase heme-binding subunit YedZ